MFVHDSVWDTSLEQLMESRPASGIPLPVQPQPAADLPYSEFTQRIENGRIEVFSEPAAPPLRQSFTSHEREEDLPVIQLRSPAGPAPRFDFSSAPIRLERTPAKMSVPDTHGPSLAGA